MLVCIVGAAAIATGYVLAYLLSEAGRPAIGWTHAGLGVLAFLSGLTHSR